MSIWDNLSDVRVWCCKVKILAFHLATGKSSTTILTQYRLLRNEILIFPSQTTLPIFSNSFSQRFLLRIEAFLIFS